MKRVFFTLLALATLFSFVGCSDPEEPKDESEPTLDDSKSTYDDSKSIKVEVGDTYGNYLYFAPVSVNSGYSQFNIEFRFESEKGTCVTGKIHKNSRTASESATTDKAGYQIASSPCFAGAQYDDWSTGSAVKKDCADTANKLELVIQNGNDNWKPVSGTIYVKRAWLSGDGKDDKVLDLKTAPVNPYDDSKSIRVDIDESNLYSCYLYFTPIDAGSGYTDFHFEYRFESKYGKYGQAKLSYQGEDASESFTTEKDGYQTGHVKCLDGAFYDDWSTDPAVKKPCPDYADRMAFLAQDENWGAVPATFYVKKAWLTGDGKDDLILELKN